MIKSEERATDKWRRVHQWELWHQRYVALDAMIGTLATQIDGTAARSETFRVLLPKLREFAKEQFSFLYDGLDRGRGNKRCLEPSLQYPGDFVLEATLDQIAFDLTVLQGAWYQRVLAKDNVAMVRTFEIADQLAYHALLPAIEYKLLPFTEGDVEQVTVLTYFQKAPHIRMIPYASVALVGIPFTTLSEYPEPQVTDGESAKPEEGEGVPHQVGNARDLLSIPHEIGHYVYRHGSYQNSRLQNALHQALLGQPDWLADWAEEIFADVYGVLVAGPVIVRDFQDIMKDNELVTLVKGDSTHPTPVLRPLLYADALDLLAGRADEPIKTALQELAKEAVKRWNDHRGNRGRAEIEEKRAVIKEAVAEVFKLLTGPAGRAEENVAPTPIALDDLWSLPDTTRDAGVQYDDLYEDFYRQVAAQIDGLLSRLRRTALDHNPNRSGTVPPDLDADWKTPLQKIPTLQWLDQIRKSLTDCSGQNARIPTEVWTLVVSMNGWATNGPEDNPSPKIT